MIKSYKKIDTKFIRKISKKKDGKEANNFSDVKEFKETSKATRVS